MAAAAPDRASRPGRTSARGAPCPHRQADVRPRGSGQLASRGTCGGCGRPAGTPGPHERTAAAAEGGLTGRPQGRTSGARDGRSADARSADGRKRGTPAPRPCAIRRSARPGRPALRPCAPRRSVPRADGRAARCDRLHAPDVRTPSLRTCGRTHSGAPHSGRWDSEPPLSGGSHNGPPQRRASGRGTAALRSCVLRTRPGAAELCTPGVRLDAPSAARTSRQTGRLEQKPLWDSNLRPLALQTDPLTTPPRRQFQALNPRRCRSGPWCGRPGRGAAVRCTDARCVRTSNPRSGVHRTPGWIRTCGGKHRTSAKMEPHSGGGGGGMIHRGGRALAFRPCMPAPGCRPRDFYLLVSVKSDTRSGPLRAGRVSRAGCRTLEWIGDV